MIYFYVQKNGVDFNLTNEEKIYMFEKMPIGSAVAKLAIPSVIGCLVMILYNLADTVFVGKLGNPVQNAAVTIVAPIILAFNAVNNLFGVGGSSLMSRALGNKDYDTVRKSSSFSFYGAIICAVLLSLISSLFKKKLLFLLGATDETYSAACMYMFWTVSLGAVPSILNVVLGNLVRAEGSVLHATIGTMSGCILNIFLDPIFILPEMLDMGAAGAGLATFISNTAACLYFFVLLSIKKKNTFVCISPKYFNLKKRIVTGVCGVGIPASIQNLLNVTGMSILNNFMSKYGSDPVAAIGIAHKVTMVPMYVSMGIAQGVMPLVGFNYAAGNRKRVKSSIKYTMVIGSIFMILATVVLYLFSENIVSMIIDNKNVAYYGGAFMKGLSLAQPFLAMDFLAVGIFQACGMGGKSFIFSLLRKIVLEIPAIIILEKIYPMYGMAYSQLIAEFVLAIAALYFIVKIIKAIPEKEDIN